MFWEIFLHLTVPGLSSWLCYSSKCVFYIFYICLFRVLLWSGTGLRQQVVHHATHRLPGPASKHLHGHLRDRHLCLHPEPHLLLLFYQVSGKNTRSKQSAQLSWRQGNSLHLLPWLFHIHALGHIEVWSCSQHSTQASPALVCDPAMTSSSKRSELGCVGLHLCATAVIISASMNPTKGENESDADSTTTVLKVSAADSFYLGFMCIIQTFNK